MSTNKKLFIPIMFLIIVFVGVAIWTKMETKETAPELCAAALDDQVQLVCSDTTGIVVVDNRSSTGVGIANESAATTNQVAMTSLSLDNDQQLNLRLPNHEPLMLRPLK